MQARHAGRPQQPVDPGGGPVQQLALALRELRENSGNPPYHVMATRAHYSRSALARAAAGAALPSRSLVLAYVRACGGDQAEWDQRWAAAAAQAGYDGDLEHAGAPPQDDGPAPRDGRDTRPAPSGTVRASAVPAGSSPGRRWRRPALATVAVAAVALSVAGGWMATGTSAPGNGNASGTNTSAGTGLPAASASHASGSARAAAAGVRIGPARDNSDPYGDGCQTDERELGWKPVYRKDGAMFGVIALMYSPACEAAWGYLQAPNSSKWTIHIITQRIPGPGTDKWQFSGNTDFGSWGNVLSTLAGCVYAEAWVADKSGQGPVSRTACMKPSQ